MESPSYALDSHEMRCLSVTKSMIFLMGAEFDLFLAATKARGEEVHVEFPALHPEYRRALAMCAVRFQLTVEDGSKPDTSVVKGRAVLPLLRYVDFLPGLLHLDEILSVGNVRITRTDPKPVPGQPRHYEACTIDYAPYRDEEPKFEASAFFTTIDQGLPLATMAHLIRFEVAKLASAADAVKSFQRFSHWNKFDLRWDDEETKRHAVIVMPSTADVQDIFDKYEDESTDDESTLLFRLRPVAPCAHVPYLEDALIRRLREQHWGDVKAMWAADKRNAHGVPAVMVTGIPPSTSLSELVAPFGKASVAEASLVAESGPSKRRRLFLQFADAESARAALGQDGQRMAGVPGKPVLRVQVSPPFMNAARRGSLLQTTARGSRSPSPQAAGDATPPAQAAEKDAAGKSQGRSAEKDAAAPAGKQKGKAAATTTATKGRSPQQGPAAPPAATPVPSGAVGSSTPPQPRGGAQQAAGGGGRSPQQQGPAAAKPSATGEAAQQPKPQQARKGTSPQARHADPAPAADHGAAVNGANNNSNNAKPQRAMNPARDAIGAPQPSVASSAAPLERENTAGPQEIAAEVTPAAPVIGTKLNSAAAPFVPSRSSPNMSFTMPPPPYSTPAAGPQAAPPPPPYTMMGSFGGPSGSFGCPPPPPFLSPSTTPSAPPPAYAPPPSYAPPPAYNRTPQAGPQAAPLPPPPSYQHEHHHGGMGITTGSTNSASEMATIASSGKSGE